MKTATKQSPQYVCLNDTVLVQRLAPEYATNIEKIAQEVAGTLSNKAVIVAVNDHDPELQVGDTVLFSEFAANDVELDGQKFLLLNRRQVYLRLGR